MQGGNLANPGGVSQMHVENLEAVLHAGLAEKLQRRRRYLEFSIGISRPEF